ncbi:MAG: Regulatory protein PchR [Pseudomonas citronellolis]|nr:MAG: Regulatory protein PchR [Pseudomonas citronellolis]
MKSSSPYRIAADTAQRCLSASGWERQSLPEALGRCYSERLALEPGLLLVRTRYHPLCELLEDSVSAPAQATLVITLGLDGCSHYRSADGNGVDFRAGYSTVTAFNGSRGQRHYRAGETVSQLRLLLTREVLERYLGEAPAQELLGNGHLRQLGYQRSSAASRACAEALARHARSAESSRLELQIQALSLLREAFRSLNVQAPAQRLNAAEVQRLEQARDLLCTHLEQPLTLAWLAAQVGSSESRLRDGWKRHFGCTLSEDSLGLRMRHAHALLEGGCQVAQAAWAVGYRHAHNFSVAFSRFHGYPPSRVSGHRQAP